MGTSTSAPRTARERVRLELTAEIKAVARRHVAAEGAVGLSLRAVARELGMASSAVYRYFPSRDDLLTALIVDAYDAVGLAAETADPGDGHATADRWLAVARTIRGWATDNPQEYALIYGSPVPGYQAPTDTIDPASRVALVFLFIVRDGFAGGELSSEEPLTVGKVVTDDFEALRAAAAPDVPDVVLSRGLAVWTQLFGMISFELFGHFTNVINDFDDFFDLQMTRAGAYLLDGR